MKHVSWLRAVIALCKDISYNALKPGALVHLKYGVCHQKSKQGDFPSGPVVKILNFLCRSLGAIWVDPWSGNYHLTCCVVQPKKKKTKQASKLVRRYDWVQSGTPRKCVGGDEGWYRTEMRLSSMTITNEQVVKVLFRSCSSVPSASVNVSSD